MRTGSALFVLSAANTAGGCRGLPGADLWEGLMERAGQESTPVFSGRRQTGCWRKPKPKLKHSGMIISLAGTQDGYLHPQNSVMSCFERIPRRRRKIGVTSGNGLAEAGNLYARCCRKIHRMPCIWAWAVPDVFTGHVKRAPKVWQNMGLEYSSTACYHSRPAAAVS